MGLDGTAGPGMNHDTRPHPEKTPYFFHFPDGNATLARLLVRQLIPAALPGSTADDSVTARADYAALDRSGAPTRLRLSSTVVRVKHHPDADKSTAVDVDYVTHGSLRRVRAGNVVLACWHAVIPHLCPELPDEQRVALADAVKVPLVYTNVLVRQWQAFHQLKASAIHCPGSYHTTVNLARMVHVGQHRSPVDPTEPMVLHLMRTPCSPGLPARQQHKMGRVELLSTTAAQIEKATIDQLDRILGPGGFDSRRDLLGLTINRWSHGYPYQYSSLWDPFWIDGGPLPCERARRPFGRITIANADAAAYSYADAAFDQAHRAIRELIERRG
jgi:spermidine dehydrogenase